MEIEAPNPSKSAELAVATVKGGLSAIPLVGGLAVEVGALYLDPLRKRNDKWICEVTTVLNELYKRSNRLPEELAKDDRFLSMLYHATSTAWKNHQSEKLLLLRSGLISAGSDPQIEDDKCFQHFRLVDELTVSHVKLLAGLSHHIGQFARCTTLESLFGRWCSLEGKWLSRSDFRVLLEDLHSRFLVHRGDLEDFPEFASKASYIALEESSMQPLQITQFGKDFLRFIAM